jgi:raffinose/stachyose/melibiose transport system substrate-binding protein
MREKILNGIGLGLLAVCFIAALGRIAVMKLGSNHEGQKQVIVRIAHWQLENGPKEAFDKIAQEYMRLHPGVKVEPLPIPEKIYPNWAITQLIGETAPDIIQVRTWDNTLTRFFVPLSELADKPNPYNKGTDLEGVPLRQTFFDGMEGGYSPLLLEYYWIPVSASSIRLFYNLDLLEEITGSRQLPVTYEEFISLCEKIAQYARAEKLPLVPIAGSSYNAPFLMKGLFSSQTQKLSEQLSDIGTLTDDPIGRTSDWLEGRWSFETEAVRSGLALMRETGQYMQPGFIQLMRDDATLLFIQRRAVIICTGSWDATSIRQQVRFRVGVTPIPYPSAENPRFGKFTLGALSEAGTNAAVSFGLTRKAPNAEVARDFLLFLASRQANQIWTDVSGWIPAIVGTRPGSEVQPFLPVADGYLAGLQPTVGDGPDTTRLFNTSLHLLVNPMGSVESFIKAAKDKYPDALASDLRRNLRANVGLIQRGDTQFAALEWTARGKKNEAARRLDIFLQADSANQRQYYRARLTLEKAGQPTQ